jgi:hypothetical protein
MMREWWRKKTMMFIEKFSINMRTYFIVKRSPFFSCILKLVISTIERFGLFGKNMNY